MKRYDLVVIGAGPSGLSAAIEARDQQIADLRQLAGNPQTYSNEQS